MRPDAADPGRQELAEPWDADGRGGTGITQNDEKEPEMAPQRGEGFEKHEFRVKLERKGCKIIEHVSQSGPKSLN